MAIWEWLLAVVVLGSWSLRYLSAARFWRRWPVHLWLYWPVGIGAGYFEPLLLIFPLLTGFFTWRIVVRSASCGRDNANR